MEKDGYKDAPLDQIELVYSRSLEINSSPVYDFPVIIEPEPILFDEGDEAEAIILHFLFWWWMPTTWMTDMYTSDATREQCYEF